MATIQGIEGVSELSGQLGGAPEDAAKIFMRTATEGLAVVIRDALNQAIGEASVGAEDADWTKLVKACAINMAWSTPPGTPPQTAVALALPDAALGGNVSVGISISGTF